MTSSHPTSRRTATRAAIALVIAAGTTAALTGTASAHTSAGGVTVAPLTNGLYQSAYSERNNVLWTTSAVGRPPVVASSLLKVDPKTLKVKQTITPPVTDAATGALEAVYGVAVDDEHNTVWTTNTRNNTVAVYDQRTGKHLATLADVNHPREIVVDERHDTVWASGFSDGTLVAFDSKTFKEKQRITVDGSGPTGLVVNEKTGTAYAADLNGDQVIVATVRSATPRLVPAGDGPISIALSKNGKTAYTANQNGGDLSVIDLKKGLVTKSVATGAGPLSVAGDDRSGNVVVVNRTDATATVVDPAKGTVVRTVTTGANPNHVTVADGTAYVVDKSGAGLGGADQIHRFRVAR
ncbi:40-residue YVTN family beta-propeller repeat-containing protein [Streptomyces sp. LamerLS-316]|uniref:YncE family protein n=1 Tax=unclassified Streptomyces TaxID=2593676 RepID=UPI0008239100|nr:MULTISPECIES: YncE family protein [unclassified Streptomyces]MYQ37448.1 YncE family protein [Streptomyces sp. SID4921]SCK44654.1 40-residue YVTN family beta-propeller repeat-containing protein [Streptomyces sp. LamerLS-316]